MNFVWEHWGRFVWWAGQNAGAIQAMSGVGTLLLTAVLAYITWRYVRLTGSIALVTRSQFESDHLPKLSFPKFDIDASMLVAHVTLKNEGSRPFRVISLAVAPFDKKAQEPLFPRMELSEYRNTVVAPNADLSFTAPFGLILQLAAPEHARGVEAVRRFHIWLIVWCCDLADHQDHTYIYRSDTRDTLYYRGKMTPDQLNERFTIAANHGIKVPDGLERVPLNDIES